MANPVFLVNDPLATTREAMADHGYAPRRLVIEVDLLPPAAGSNERGAIVHHHVDVEQVRDDPGLIGDLIRSLNRKTLHG